MAEFSFVDLIPGFAEHEHEGWHQLFGHGIGHPVLNPNGHISMTHVVFGVASAVVIVLLALVARTKYSNRDDAIVPEGHLSVRNFFELIFDTTYGMMSDMMGEHHARRYFPLIASLAVFILISNLMGLIPGFVPPTSNLNTNVGPAVVVFLIYHFAGFRENGLGHIKHMGGPIWWMWPLIFIIELVGHFARPVSLSIRLTGNMTGDHMVLGVFGELAEKIVHLPLVFPIPFLFLGLLVAVIQTLVFCMLSAVYIALAVAHDEH